MIAYSVLSTSALGDLFLTANSSALLGVYFCGCRHAPAVRSDWRENPAHPILRQAGEEIGSFLNGERTEFSLPLQMEGTAFQKAVWREIARIPFGETISYTELARRAGVCGAIRAVGTATGRNPLSIIVPCHRVVGKGGSLTGYAGGLERKRRLLDLERPAALFGGVVKSQLLSQLTCSPHTHPAAPVRPPTAAAASK